MNGDRVDDAIAMAAAAAVNMVEVPIRINVTGRPAVVAVPDDITDPELIELTAFMLGGLRAHIAKHRPAGGLIVPPRGLRT